MSKKFPISRGARQGDPIASYIFIICIEILAHRLRCDRNVKGFQLKNGLSHLLELYADDCSIFLDPTDENLREVLEILDDFKNISGLKISLTKTKAVWFGSGWNNNFKLYNGLYLDWSSSFKLLGI